jgi:hypothetical protein
LISKYMVCLKWLFRDIFLMLQGIFY